MGDKEVFLDFYGIKVLISSKWVELIERISGDFSYFKVENCEPYIKIQVDNDRPLWGSTDKWDWNTTKVKFVDRGNERECNYQDRVKVVYDFKLEAAFVVGDDLHRVHEVTYLLILSRVGKLLDLQGVHRLHSMAFSYNEKLVIGAFSSGHGKSTLLSFLLEDSCIKLFSDDCPLVTTSGEVLPFPLRLGFESDGLLPSFLKDASCFRLKRRRFGEKKLFPLNNLNLTVGKNYKEIIVLSSGGRGSREFQWEKVNGFSSLLHFLREGLIGVGLPMVYEYFWEIGFRDFLLKLKIFFSRLYALGWLWIKAKKIRVTLSSDLSSDVLKIKEELEKN